MTAAAVRLEIRDQLDHSCRAEIERNEPVHRILPSIVEHMNLPKVGLDGQPLRYSLELLENGRSSTSRRLGWDETLEVAGAAEDAVLLVFAEMIAG